MRHVDENRIENTYKYIEAYYVKNGKTPSLRTILKECHYNGGVGCVQKDIKRLKDRNMLLSDIDGSILLPNEKRADESFHVAPKFISPIPCGQPNLMEADYDELVILPNSIFGNKEHFILTAKGNSMIERGIFDGDLLVVRSQNTAEFGESVIAIIDNESTAKILAKDKDGVPYLKAANPDRNLDVYVAPKELKIAGVIEFSIHDPNSTRGQVRG